MPTEHALYSGCRNAVAFGDLPYALPLAAFAVDGIAIDDQRSAADVPALEACTPHAGADPLDNKVAFEFGDGADDDDDGAAQRAARVDLLAEADELDIEAVQLVEHVEEVLHRAGDPVRGPDQDHVEAAAAGIVHQLVQTGPARFRAGDPVGVFPDDFIAALGGHLAEVEKLSLRVLIQAGDAQVQGGAFHLRRPFDCLVDEVFLET